VELDEGRSFRKKACLWEVNIACLLWLVVATIEPLGTTAERLLIIVTVWTSFWPCVCCVKFRGT
jgi:hypothetical protein